MKHKHHIIPKHAGGTDDPSNLIELTVKDHADAHRILYEKYGKIQDYYAWQGLLGNIGKSEIFMNLMKSDDVRTKIKTGVKKYWNSLSEEEKIQKRNVFLEVRKLTTGSTGKNWTLSEETKLKQSKPKSKEHKEKLKLNHADFSGSNNPSYGTIWITNSISSMKINKNDIIPDGWKPGRAFKERKKKVN